MVNISTLHKFNQICCSPNKTQIWSRAFSISGPVLWRALPVPIRNAHTILASRNLLKSHLIILILFSHPSSSVARLPVDEPALASIMPYDHAKDVCSSELGPLRI